MYGEFFKRVRQHFTPAELVDFLDISFNDVWDNFQTTIMDHYTELVDEVCFTIDGDIDEEEIDE